MLGLFDEYLNWSFAGNTGFDYALAFGIFLFSTIAFWVFKHFILFHLRSLAKKTSTQYDDMIVDFVDGIKPPVYLLLSLYLSSRFLSLDAVVSKGIEYAVVIGLTYYAVKGVHRIISHAKEILVQRRFKEDGHEDTSLLDALEGALKIIVWIIAILLILSNLGVDITALLAGLGIGGLAIAIASQAVLSDIFASLSIYFDKPFKVGDFIIIGEDMGVVKKIGIKTTRIQTLQGQELVISNQELTTSRVNNYKRMEKRRVQFAFGVVYGTPVSKLKKIPGMVAKILNSVKSCKADRVHFKEFGDFSLNFEAVYYLDSSDYNKYMDVQQEINLKIASEFEKAKIEFAFPTQTVHVKKG